MSLFTFISEVAGSTVVEQDNGENVIEAIVRWSRSSQLKPSLNDDLVDISATPVTEVSKVWCISGLTERGEIFITHIVATSVDT